RGFCDGRSDQPRVSPCYDFCPHRTWGRDRDAARIRGSPMADLARFTEATAEVRHSPHAVSAWEEAEALAAELVNPDDIVALYTETLAAALEPDVAEMIGERAGSFCDEWFGDDPSLLEKILTRVLEFAPASE